MILKLFRKGKKKQRKLAEEKYSAIEKYIGDNLEHDGLFDDAPTDLELHSSFEEYAQKAWLKDESRTAEVFEKYEERFDESEAFDFLVEDEVSKLKTEIVLDEEPEDYEEIREETRKFKKSISSKKEVVKKEKASSRIMFSRRSLDDVIAEQEESFSQSVLRLIDEKGLKDADIYRKANIDRRLFSKIRSDRDYRPSRTTAIALAIALELELDKALDLISKSGFTLSRVTKFDLIVRYFIEEGNYDIFEINDALYAFGQPILAV